jgi:type II secretory pathway pseudopilin PulG
MMNIRTKKGFTIIELMLSMSFLAVLMITIAILTIRIVSIYQKGLAIRAVSSTGRALIDDFTRSVASAPIQIQLLYGHDDYFFSHTATIDVNGHDVTAQLFGGFCTGSNSYLWNTGYTINDPTLRLATYSGNSFHLLKISDPSREICSGYSARKNTPGGATYSILSYFPQVGTADGLELLDQSEDALAIYDFKALGDVQNAITGHSFYAATFILATLRGGVDIFAQGDYCQDPPDNLNTDFNYCAINKFNFAMRATGETTDVDDYGERTN